MTVEGAPEQGEESAAPAAPPTPGHQDNVRRFGDYSYDLTIRLEPMDVHLTLDEDTNAA